MIDHKYAVGDEVTNLEFCLILVESKHMISSGRKFRIEMIHDD